MFGFLYKEMEMTGAAERFPIRIDKFRKAEKRFPMLQHYFWWVMHNCVTHLLIGLVPIKPFFQFHDWTSVKLNAGEAALSTPLEDLEACKSQVIKLHDKLKEMSGNEFAGCIETTSMLIDELNADIEYHTNNGTDKRGRKFRTAFRLTFKEK